MPFEASKEDAESLSDNAEVRSEPKVDFEWVEDPIPVSEAAQELSKQISRLYEEDNTTNERLRDLEELAQKQSERVDQLEETIEILAAVSRASLHGQCPDCGCRLEVKERMMSENTIECSQCENIVGKVE